MHVGMFLLFPSLGAYFVMAQFFGSNGILKTVGYTVAAMLTILLAWIYSGCRVDSDASEWNWERIDMCGYVMLTYCAIIFTFVRSHEIKLKHNEVDT